MASRRKVTRMTLRILSAYLLATVAMSCVDVTYKWETSLAEAEYEGGWYYDAGLRSAMFVVENHGHPGAGFHLDVHCPAFQLIPFLSSVGPDGGGSFVALWFVGGIACGIHFALRRRVAARKAMRMTSDS
jgi:hypothetical protein